jgi:hypothetical protein
MKRITRFLFLLVLALSMGGLSALAQFSSGIEGTVQDQSGARIPGAKVTITDIRLGVEKNIITNQSGYFRFDSIAASEYKVRIEMAGFKTWEQKSLVVQVGQTSSLAPALEVGAESTNVTVSAAQASVDLVSATTGSVIAETTLEQTPLPGQNVYGLGALTPGMTGSAVNSADNYTNEYAININAAGLRQEQNGFQIDDAYTNTPSRGGGTSISPNPEIVQSMDIRTNDFDAAKGRNAGATVDVYTKSGSNDFHGSFNYYFLNDSLTARTQFQTKVPVYTRNEVGGTFGGAILKNRFFIFGALDVLRSSTTSSGQYTVETQDFDTWAQTNLSKYIAPTVLKTAPPLSFPTTNIQTVAQLEASTPGHYTPPTGIPSTLNAVGTANISYSVPKNGYQWSIRGDYYLGQNDRVYVTTIRTHYTGVSSTPRPALNFDQSNSSDFVNANWTHTFSPRLLNQASVNMIRPYGSDLPVATDAIPYINVTGLQGFSNWGPGNFTQTTYGWRDVMTATVKSHTLKFGFDQFNIREADTQSGAFDRPTYNFNSLLDFVQDAAYSETATPVNLATHKEAPYQRYYRALYTGVYVQDDWKVNPRLTINAGLRYDGMANFFSIYSPARTNFTFGSGATRDAQIAAGVTGLGGTPHVLDHTIWGLTPRVGFALDLFGKGQTAIRGGFGMYEDQPPYLRITDITAGNLPNFYTPSISVQSGKTPVFQLCDAPSGWTEVCPVVDTSNVVLNSAGGVVGERASIGGYSPDFKLTQVYDWTLSVQQQLGASYTLEANYSGSSAHHLPIFNDDLNRFAGDLITNKGTLTRLNQNFGAMNYGESNGNSIGHYGTVMLSRRQSHGLALRGIYTYGKALDYVSNAVSLDSGSITTTTPVIRNGDLAPQRGRADFDIRQQFSADGTWTVPNHYNSLLARNVLGGWQFGGVLILQTGLPFTVYTSASFNPVYDADGNVTSNTGGDYNADGRTWDVPNTPTFGRHLTGQKKKNYLNGLFAASSFPTPTLGSEGNLGRNTYDQPGYNNVDFTFEKFFTTPWFFGEKLKLQAKGEVINLFNRTNLNTVTSDLSSSLFGHSTSQLPSRYLQFHLRASF